MKTLRYIYALLIALLFGYVISSCDDIDDIVEDDATEVSYSGKMVKTSFSVGLSASDVSGDVDVETRAGMDNANTDYPQPENGGRFKNIVIVLVNDQDRVYGVHCKDFDNTSGVKDYNYVFSDIEIPDTDINKKQYKVYAFGNVCKEHYANIVKNDENRNFLTNHVNLSNLDAYKYCINNVTIELNNPGDIYNSSKDVKDLSLYNITFEPDTKYLMKVNNADTTVTSVGMPENNTATATVMKGNTQFNVRLHRVCARIKITFRNLTGQYTNQQGDKIGNNVYIDQFKTDNSAMFFAYNTKYLYDANADVNYTAQAPFDLLQALNCKVNGKTESDHVHNKIENDSVLTVSMYVFEIQNSNGWKYDLKVDRGKSLGLNTTVIDPDNAYVIWNNQEHHSLAYKENYICASGEQTSKDNIPFSDQVFWKIENAPDAKLPSTYVLKHCSLNVATDVLTDENIYLKQQGDPSDWGIHYYCSKHNTTLNNFLDIIGHYIGALFSGGGCNISNQLVPGGFKHTFVNAPATSTTDAQYVNFVLDPSSNVEQSRFTFNLLKGGQKTQDVNYWNQETQNRQTSYNYLFLAVENSALCCSRGAAFNTAGTLDNFDWTLYAKYIIKNGRYLSEKKNGTETKLTKIERNHTYELEYNVMPNYTEEEDLKVRCVRTQNEVSWSEVQK